MLHCTCGFTCGTQGALDKHFAKFADTDAASEHMVNTMPSFSLPGCHSRPRGVTISGPAPDCDKSRRSISCPDELLRAGGESPASGLSMSASFASTGMSTQAPHSPSSNATSTTPTPVSSSSSSQRRSLLAVAGSATLGVRPQTGDPRQGYASCDGDRGRYVRLLVIRHAQSANKQRQPGQKASADPDLTELGYEQAYSLSQRLVKEFPSEMLARNPPTIISSPMRRCLLTIQPTVQRLKLGKDNCLCHGGFYEFGCTGLDKRTSTPSDITYEFPEFSPTGFSASGQWDYRGSNLKETEQEHKERGLRLVEWLQDEAAASLRARCTGTDCPTILLAIHQSLADLLLQILVEGTAEKWSYGDIENKVTNAAFTEVFLYANRSASLGVSNDDRHHQSRRYSTIAAKTAPQFRPQKTCVF